MKRFAAILVATFQIRVAKLNIRVAKVNTSVDIYGIRATEENSYTLGLGKFNLQYLGEGKKMYQVGSLF